MRRFCLPACTAGSVSTSAPPTACCASRWTRRADAFSSSTPCRTGGWPLDSPAFLRHTFQCLDCRACETACPSGVKYGALIESVRAQTVQAKLLPTRRRIAQTVLRVVFPRPKLLRLAARGLWVYQRSGLQALVRRLGFLRWIAPTLAAVEALSPPVSDRFLQASDLRFVPAYGERRHSVAFITGCIMSVSFAEAHRASLRVLARYGCDVHIPEHQSCCGALHVHGGDRETARELARRNIDAFDAAEYEAIIINSAGCGSTLKEYGELLADDRGYADRAYAFAGRVRDLSEFLAGIGRRAAGRIDQRARDISGRVSPGACPGCLAAAARVAGGRARRGVGGDGTPHRLLRRGRTVQRDRH